jgi:putative PIN family toxin of toxin-antitoxin system
MENRTVFDTNIWISYIIKFKYDELAVFVEKKDVRFLRSAPSLAELQDVLSRKKFQKYEINFDRTIAFYKNLTEFCETQTLFKDCPDPKDNFLFDLALQGNAKYLVSGDPDVLKTPVTSEILQVTKLLKFKEDFQVL